MHADVFPLAQDTTGAADALIWSAVVLGVCVAMFWLISVIRKRLRDTTISDVPPAGFTLSDLRRLHESGQMNDEEFERAKAKLLAVTKFAANAPAASPKRPQGLS